MRQHQAQRWEIDAVSGINAPKSEKKAWKVAFVTHRLAVTLCLVDNMRKQGAEWSMFGTPSQLGTVFKGAISQIA